MERSEEVAGSVDLVVRCSLSAWRRCLGVKLMVGDVRRVIERLGAWRRRVAGSDLGFLAEVGGAKTLE